LRSTNGSPSKRVSRVCKTVTAKFISQCPFPGVSGSSVSSGGPAWPREYRGVSATHRIAKMSKRRVRERMLFEVRVSAAAKTVPTRFALIFVSLLISVLFHDTRICWCQFCEAELYYRPFTQIRIESLLPEVCLWRRLFPSTSTE